MVRVGSPRYEQSSCRINILKHNISHQSDKRCLGRFRYNHQTWFGFLFDENLSALVRPCTPFGLFTRPEWCGDRWRRGIRKSRTEDHSTVPSNVASTIIQTNSLHSLFHLSDVWQVLNEITLFSIFGYVTVWRSPLFSFSFWRPAGGQAVGPDRG